MVLPHLHTLGSWVPVYESCIFDSVQVTDPYLNLWRNLVPPLLGTIDLTPLFGFLILQFLEGALSITDDDNDYL